MRWQGSVRPGEASAAAVLGVGPETVSQDCFPRRLRHSLVVQLSPGGKSCSRHGGGGGAEFVGD